MKGVWCDSNNDKTIELRRDDSISSIKPNINGINIYYPKYCEVKRIRTIKYNKLTNMVFDSIKEYHLNDTCGCNHINFSKRLSIIDVYNINKCEYKSYNELYLLNELRIESILNINHIGFNEMIVNELRIIYGKSTYILNTMYYVKNQHNSLLLNNNSDTVNNLALTLPII